jgi:hypothetical protein
MDSHYPDWRFAVFYNGMLFSVDKPSLDLAEDIFDVGIAAMS